jgi:hypothetical protein
MKKIILGLSILLLTAGMCFAQSSDLQVLTTVKYNKSESITVRELKKRCAVTEKQYGVKLTVDQRKAVLSSLVDEKLVAQAAAKAGLTLPDSTIDQYFMEAMSQTIGTPVTEKQLDELLKAQNTTLDETLQQQTGMNVTEYKAFLKNQLIMRQYVMSQRQNEIQTQATPTDAEIRAAYEGNKASFVWSDMVRVFAVGVNKDPNPDNAKNKINELRNKYIDKKVTKDQLLSQAKAKGADFSATEILIPKTEAGAAQLTLSYDSILGIYEQDVGTVFDVTEDDKMYVFLVLTQKYAAKLLSLSDIVSPDSTVTVYEYIRQMLAQQKLQTVISQAAQDIVKELHKPEYVEEKKTGAALDKLLNWGD